MEDTGIALCRRLREGDGTALDEMIEVYFDGLVAFIGRYVRDEHAAEDLAMDVFFEVMTHPSRYNGSVSVKTYLYMLGRCRALNYLRHHARISVTDPEEMAGVAAPETPEEALLRSERERVVTEAVAALPKEMAEAVTLVYLDGLSYKEAAVIMKKSPKQVDNLLSRAKLKLRGIIGEEGRDLI